jgi:hypothetical protein
MGKINISIGNELYNDIEQIARHRLSSQALLNVNKKFVQINENNLFYLVVCFKSISIR